MMQSDTEPKFCKDCKHFRPPMSIFGYCGVPESCYHPKNMGEPELVHGRSYPLAENADLRKSDAICGPDGAMFEAAPPEPPPKPYRGPCAYVMVTPPPKRRFWEFLGF